MIKIVKDIITYNEKQYQLSTVNLDGLLETMVFPIENGIVSGNEVYCFRTTESWKSLNKHKDIYFNPSRYLTDDAIKNYIRSKEEYFNGEETIQFSTEDFKKYNEYLEKYITGQIGYDAAIDSMINEIYELIGKYFNKKRGK